MKAIVSENNLIKYSFIISGIIIILVIPDRFLFDSAKSVCVFRNFTGILCPLCGMTRASHEMLHFQPVSAFSYNPLSILLPLLLMIEIINDFTGTVLFKKIRRTFWIITVCALLVLFVFRIVIHYMH